MTDPLDRIAAALERIAPPVADDADALAHPAYVWRDGRLAAARSFAPLPLDLLLGVESQKAALFEDFARLAAGNAAHDILLWGSRGAGKSALVKSVVASIQAGGGKLALIEVSEMTQLRALFDRIDGLPRAFLLFLDDLGFDVAGDARALRSLLQGGAEARPANARLVVTANRRHLVPRDITEQESAINPRDSVDDHLALADRFGLSLGFHVLDQAGYLAIVKGYTDRFGLPYEPDEAVGWATRRGSRSGRVAWHYITDLAGRSGQKLPF
jgi:predicted AAA+ superfamily ATPase